MNHIAEVHPEGWRWMETAPIGEAIEVRQMLHSGNWHYQTVELVKPDLWERGGEATLRPGWQAFRDPRHGIAASPFHSWRPTKGGVRHG